MSKRIINENDKRKIEEKAQQAFHKVPSMKRPETVQNGSINIANYGSGSINFTGLTFKELTDKYGELIPVTLTDKPVKFYQSKDKEGIHFVFDDDQCIATFVSESYTNNLKAELKEKVLLNNELLKQIELYDKMVENLKDEINFLRKKLGS